MKRAPAVLASFFLIAGLTACGGSSQLATTTSEPTTAASTTATTTSTQAKKYAPGDNHLHPVDALGTVGVFIDPETDGYYVCNGGKVTKAEGSPVESGVCEGPMDFAAAGELGTKLSDAVAAAMQKEFEHPPAEPATPTPAPAEAKAEPYVVRCLEGTPGPAEWSDGSTRYSEECFQKMGGTAYVEQESQSGLQPGGAAVNGYGTDANGNPNRSSGDLQAEWGCQQGYITDPAICSQYQ